MLRSFERRDKIKSFLSEKRETTYNELAEIFQVSKKTIREDIDLLSDSVPLYTVSGRGGGIKVVESWYSNDTCFSMEQENLLKSILPTLNNEQQIIMREILNKFSIPSINM